MVFLTHGGSVKEWEVVDGIDDTATAGAEPRAARRRRRPGAGRGGGTMSRSADDRNEEEVDTSHLDDVEDGCGCAEVWEHLSDERDRGDESRE